MVLARDGHTPATKLPAARPGPNVPIRSQTGGWGPRVPTLEGTEPIDTPAQDSHLELRATVPRAEQGQGWADAGRVQEQQEQGVGDIISSCCFQKREALCHPEAGGVSRRWHPGEQAWSGGTWGRARAPASTGACPPPHVWP